ncbi:uncharacterized protein LOC120545302 [Perca fluviatilis]|uniref:uncharacterized protein LOC120545302 n=1 Tax=Perca fluviatilis TaxID=8168 RepID=UPI001963AA3C|nr:uncharacterized protein LOC120545302 [Perca fluviatilis]
MASTPRRRRRRSIDIPSELMDKLKNHSASFIREVDSSEPKMRPIVREFREIADEVRKMQETTDEVRRAAADVLEVTTFGILLGLLTGRAAGAVALAVTAGGARVLPARALALRAATILSAVAAGLGAAAAAGAGATGAAVVAAVGRIAAVIAAGSAIVVAGANVTKERSESGSVNKVKQLRTDLMEIVEPLKKALEEIKRTCEEMKQRSAEDQAEITLTDMEALQRIIRVVFELGSGDGVLSAMWKVFRLTSTPEEDRKLTDSIIQSADLCQKVIDDLKKMKEDLKDFTEQ